jgi:hypothetical protein
MRVVVPSWGSSASQQLTSVVMGPGLRQDDDGVSALIPAVCFHPSSAISLSLSLERGRRESRAPTAPAVPCAKVVKESTRVEPQVQPRHPGFPRAMALRLIRTLPGEAAFLAPVAGGKSPAGVAPGSRRQDHTTSPYAANVSSDERSPDATASIATRANVS